MSVNRSMFRCFFYHCSYSASQGKLGPVKLSQSKAKVQIVIVDRSIGEP